MPDDRTLVVLFPGRRAGIVTAGTDGRLAFTYDDAWRSAADATPLSLSMPLVQARHGDRPVRAFLTGLLPDNDRVLDRWARTYHVSAGNPFALLQHVGEDCAGAAQFARPERVDALVAGAGDVRWLGEDDVAERLRVLRADPAAWHVHNSGQFSLAGAQAKTALYLDPATGRWGEPYGAVPTTHILKPAVLGLDDHDLNEHLCLTAAATLGVPAASSQVVAFGAERAIVVERYDRSWTGTRLGRIHQEDLCQALAVPPAVTYQNQGGPTPEAIIELLRDTPQGMDSVARFVTALALGWIIGATDAHAKNYSILLAAGQVRLAPLYDVASALAYDEFHAPKLQLAMTIGGRYDIEAIAGRHWRRFADANGLDPLETVSAVDDLARTVPDAFAQAAAGETIRELGSPLPARLVDRVAARATVCRGRLRR